MKIKKVLIASGAFLFLLVAIYYIHIRFFSVNVVFYAAIFDVLIAALLSGGLLWGTRFFQDLNTVEKSQQVVIWLLLGYSLAISVPTVIDRSLSFYILEKIQQQGGGIRQDAFEVVFTKEYVKEHRLVDVRLTEQLESGTIEIKNGCVLLTKKGNLVASLGNFYRSNLLPKSRLLMGEYSDDLTAIFRNSTINLNYQCSK